MKSLFSTAPLAAVRLNAFVHPLLLALLAATTACGTSRTGNPDNFFTSGSREADQRANQRITSHDQISDSDQTEEGSFDPDTQALFDRLGGEAVITAIVDDFLQRVMHDPRVNWERKGVTTGGFLRRRQSMAWDPSPENVARLKQHMFQFFCLVTGGPTQYDGKDIPSAHADMQITNAEFDASVGDLKATLDRLHIASREQKELLALVESTRPQIVTNR